MYACYRTNSCLRFSEHTAELNEIDVTRLTQGPQKPSVLASFASLEQSPIRMTTLVG